MKLKDVIVGLVIVLAICVAGDLYINGINVFADYGKVFSPKEVRNDSAKARSEKAEKSMASEEKAIKIGAARNLVLGSNIRNIKIRGIKGNTSDIRMKYFINVYSNSDQEAKQLYDKVKVENEIQSDKIIINASIDGSRWNMSLPDIELSIPEGVNLEISKGNGNVDIVDFSGGIEFEGKEGNISVNGADSITGKLNGYNKKIYLKGIKTRLDIAKFPGKLELSDIQCPVNITMDYVYTGEDLKVSNVKGKVTLKSKNGTIELN